MNKCATSLASFRGKSTLYFTGPFNYRWLKFQSNNSDCRTVDWTDRYDTPDKDVVY